MVIALACVAYVTGWAWASWWLFCRWRPARVPLCKKDHRHDWNCYRRRLPDLTTVKIDSDRHAFMVAGITGWIWPLVGLYAVACKRSPEIPPEREARLTAETAAATKRTAELEAENERLRQGGG